MALGCDRDEQLVEMAREHGRQQAEQSRRVLELQQELQVSQAEVGRQRDAMEEERRELGQKRYMAPILAAAIQNVGLLIVCTLPLVLCWYLLRQHVEPIDDGAVTEVLLEEFSNEQPLLLTNVKNDEAEHSISRGACPRALQRDDNHLV